MKDAKTIDVCIFSSQGILTKNIVFPSTADCAHSELLAESVFTRHLLILSLETGFLDDVLSVIKMYTGVNLNCFHFHA